MGLSREKFPYKMDGDVLRHSFFKSSIISWPTVSKLHGILLNNSPRLQHVTFFDFRSCDPEIRSKFKYLKGHSTYNIEPMDMKLHSIILNGLLHDCNLSDFSISSHMTQKSDAILKRLLSHPFDSIIFTMIERRR